MTDLKEQLRVYFDEISPAFDTERLMRDPQPELAPARSGIRTGMVVAVAAAVIALLAIGLPLLLSGSGPETAVEPPVITFTPTTVDAAPTTITLPDYTAPEEVDALLACLPLDPAGWSRSESLPVPLMGDLRLATNDDTAVVVGVQSGGWEYKGGGGWKGVDQVAAYWSHDGLRWQSVDGLPDVGYSGGQPPTVAGGARGFVAVTQGPFVLDQETPAVVVFSQDGVTWEQIDPEALPKQKVQWLSDVIAGPDGFIILGASGMESFAWFSPDGRTWVTSELPIDGQGLVAVVATESGWAAMTEDAGPHFDPSRGRCYDPSTGDWYDCRGVKRWESSDGITWTETIARDAPPPDQFGGYLRQSPQVAVNGTWVLVNEFHDHGDATAWVSNDEGMTWDEYPIGGEYASYESAFYDLDVTPFGLLLAGRRDFDPTDSNILDYSQDGGVTWQHCQTPEARTGTPEITQAAMLGDTLILFDDYTGTFHTWNDPNAVP